MSSLKYRKKPVVIEALQLTWANWSEMCDFAGVGKLSDGKPEGTAIDQDGNSLNGKIGMFIPTFEGLQLARENDYVIKGIQGEFYPCKPDIFEQTYKPVD